MKPKPLDLSGLKCPLPVLRTRKALRAMLSGETLEVVATDPMSSIDIPNLVRETGDILQSSKREAGKLKFVIKKTP